MKSTALSGNYSTAPSRDSNGWCSWPQSTPVHDVSWRISDVTHLELFERQMHDGCPFLSQIVVLHDVSEVRLPDWHQGRSLRWYSPVFELFLAFRYPTFALLNTFLQTIKKIIYSGFLPACSGKFTYQSPGTIAFKIIQIQNTILFTQHHLSCLH